VSKSESAILSKRKDGVLNLFRCPFEAIAIINLPTNLESEVTHRYTANAFKLHRLPTPRPGQVLGLVGTNGIGKSTALKILAGKLKPNLGRYDVSPTLCP
jgi:ATP-binding cassette subfamily E protein 1